MVHCVLWRILEAIRRWQHVISIFDHENYFRIFDKDSVYNLNTPGQILMQFHTVVNLSWFDR